MHRRLVITALVATFLAAACGATGATPAPSAGGPVDLTGSWQLASGTVDGAPFPVVADSPITLTVQGTTIGGRAACNQYGGELTVVDGAPRFMMSHMTEMACQEPAMAAEAAFSAALPRVTAASRDGERLTLSGPGVELAFDRLEPPPLAELVGTEWVLESLVVGAAVSSVAGDPATLRLDAGGTFTGGTGCRTFSGKWIQADGGIRPAELRMDQTDCDPALQPQDGHVVGVLEGFRASIDGQTLTLTGDGGAGLVYRAAG